MNCVLTFQEALQRSSDSGKRYLLLGNGFSTALFSDIFSYKSLRQEADLSKKPELEEMFDQLGTSDFEQIIRAIEHGALAVKTYGGSASLCEKLKKDADELKQILVSTIADRHPETTNKISEEQKKSCGAFLHNFKKIYTLNYDALLYWVLMHVMGQGAAEIDDGFRLGDEEMGSDYRVFDSPHSPTFFFLHGGLHIYDSGSQTRKYVWIDSGKPIITQVREAIAKDMYPLFVAEGSSEQKMTKINHSAYLSKALRSFESICDQKGCDLFVFGHSLNDSDEHILSKIRKGTIKRVFVSAFKGGAVEYDRAFVAKAQALAAQRKERSPLEVVLFDAESAKVWSNTL